nr:hypothetical protein [Carnobacterium maltaromaticum]
MKGIKERLKDNRDNKTELEGTWFTNVVLTIVLSHLSLIFLMAHRIYFQQDLMVTLGEYCLKGTLYISGISLMSTTLLNKKNEEIPKKNKKKMEIIKILLSLILCIQAVFYSYSVDSSSIIVLNDYQIGISIFLYMLSLLLFSSFSFFNRKEIDYDESEKEKRKELTKDSIEATSSKGMDL